MRAQLNVRVGKAIKNRIAMDRKNTFATNDIIVEVALENWFTSQPPDRRERYYKAHGRKPYEKAA